jgi:tripartite-type tricarboxylate transporter receptor subunit TctC
MNSFLTSVNRRSILKAAALAPLITATSLTRSASASDPEWPTRAVKVVVPFSAGGVADVVARIVSKGLSERWNRPVVVENVVGAGGNIGLGNLVRGEADGYMLALAPGGNLTINPHYYKSLPFDVSRDFAPITLLADAPNVLVVSPKLGVRTMKELIELARSRPEGLTYASPGDGSTQHLAGALLSLRTKTKLLHVPYRGLVPALTDVLSGEVNMIFTATVTVAGHIHEGKLVALAIAGPKRTESLPNVPSMLEAGVSDFDANSWYGFIAKAGTPEWLVQRLNKDINDVLKVESDRLVAMGLVPSGKGPKQFADLIENESKRWKTVITEAGIRQQ